MRDFSGKAVLIVSRSGAISVVVWYLIIATHFNIYGHAISLPSNRKLPALLVFGDSIVDPGNNNNRATIAKANFPPYGRDLGGGVPLGRYSNGKVPSDLLAEELGIKELVPPYLDPTLQISDLLTGVSFASGAAGYDPQSAELASAISLEGQLNLFKEYINKLKTAVGENTTSNIVSNSLYLVCAGSNDITNTYYLAPFRKLHYDIPTYTTLMANWASSFIQELYGLGARKIAVISAPPCGCLPSQRTIYGGPLRECAQNLNEASSLYNSKLKSALNSLNQQLPGSTVVYLDIYNPLLSLIADPSQAGFQVVNKGCCGTGDIEVSVLCTKYDPAGVCTDASKYVFWDSFHPTQATYTFIVHELVKKNINLLYGRP